MKRCPLCEENYTQCYHDKCPGGPPDWTHDPPTEPGWYWQRLLRPGIDAGWDSHTAVEVRKYGGGMCIGNGRIDEPEWLHGRQWWPIRISEPGKEGGE